MENNHVEQMYKWIWKGYWSEKEKSKMWQLYCLIEDVCGKTANGLLRDLLRCKVNSVDDFTNFCEKYTDDEMQKYCRGVGPRKISIIRECYNYNLNLIPF